MSASGRDSDCSTPSPSGSFGYDNGLPCFIEGRVHSLLPAPEDTRIGGAPPSLAATMQPQEIVTLGTATTLATSVGNQGKHSRVMQPAGDK
jgi:hypothetical protein